jgi:hypothetical protein
MEGLLYYPYIEVPKNRWLIQSLLYWDKVATIIPVGIEPGIGADRSLNDKLLERELLFQARPSEARRDCVDAWWDGLADLDKHELKRRQKAFKHGHTARIHVEKIMYSSSYRSACRLGIAERQTQLRRSTVDPWVQVERTTAAEFMGTLAMGMTSPNSSFTRRHGSVRWLPATDQPHQLLSLVGGAARFPESNEEFHQARVNLAERERKIQAIVLGRMFPMLDEFPTDLDELMVFKNEFGPELHRFRRHVEERVVEIMNIADFDLQVRSIDQIGDEFEDEISQAEAHLRLLGVSKVTRSTLIQLARSVDSTGTVKRLARGVEEVIGGPGGVTGPLAYAAFVKLRLFNSGEDGPSAIPFIHVPDHPLIEAFGFNSTPRRG